MTEQLRMRKLQAFFVALVFFAGVVLLLHWYGTEHVVVNPRAYALWTGEAKSQSLHGLRGNMTDQMMPVFGSSEFQHGKDNFYHPAKTFLKTSFCPMLIGAGYYQSLSHAVTLAAIENEMEMRKAVLILSPQWFRKTGVVDQAYASRFSELLYQEMLKNEALSEETRAYLSERTHELLSIDTQVLQRVEKAEKLLWKKELSLADQIVQKLWLSMLGEKDRVNISLQEMLSGIRPSAGEPAGEKTDWEAMLIRAEEEGLSGNTNPFYIDDESYQRLKPHLKEKKDMNKDARKGYQTGPEFDDLRIFLQVCRETGIRPMLVLMPVNGYYYDYTGFPTEAREAYYQKIRDIAEEYGAVLADFSDQEYTQYFFEDRVHLGKKGWVMVNEAIEQFAGS